MGYKTQCRAAAWPQGRVERRTNIENPTGNYFRYAPQFVQTSEGKALLAESVCGDHLSRLSYNFAPSDLFDQTNSVFYVSTRKGETIDFIVGLSSELVPVEVKYQNKINNDDYNAIKKFKHGIIATKQKFETKGITWHYHYPYCFYLFRKNEKQN